MDLNRIVGRNIARLRRDQGLRQEDLQERCGLTQQYLSGVELGLRNVTLSTLERISVALGVAPTELLDATRAVVPKDSVTVPRRRVPSPR